MTIFNVVTFLEVDACGGLKPTLEIDVKLSDETHALYVGNIEHPENLAFECSRTVVSPREIHAGAMWKGSKTFGQKSPGGSLLAEVRRHAAELVSTHRAQGSLLSFGLEIAEAQQHRSKRWCEERIYYLASLDPSQLHRSHGGFLQAVELTLQVQALYYESWNRLLNLNISLRNLGREFCEPQQDSRAARLVGAGKLARSEG